jgi:hypothetical protein
MLYVYSRKGFQGYRRTFLGAMDLGLRKKLKKYFAVCEAKNARQRYLFAVRFVRTHSKDPFFQAVDL